MATLATDTFNRSNRNLSGDTMSDSSNTWLIGGSSALTCNISSNQAVSTGSNSIVYCNSQSGLTNIKVSLDVSNNYYPGVMGRYAPASPDYYYFRFNNGNSTTQLLRADAGSHTQLGSFGSGISASDTLTLVCDGTSISGELNGTTDVGPVTDSTYSSGYAGIRLHVSGAYGDNFLLEDIPSAGTNLQLNISDSWKSVAGMQINIGDSWKTISGMQINIGDTWKTIF